jgi:hypothetical protein
MTIRLLHKMRKQGACLGVSKVRVWAKGNREYSSHRTCVEGSVGSWAWAFSWDWALGVYKLRTFGGWFRGWGKRGRDFEELG